MPGVSILVKGSSQGTITDLEGRYALTDVPEDGILVFSFMGYLSQEVEVSGRSVIDINLEPDTKQLDEVSWWGMVFRRE